MNPIRLIRPYISYEEVEAGFRDIFEAGTFTRGQHAEAFLAEIAQYVGAKHAFLTTSATTALWTCMKLLGVGPEDEVIVSDFSWPATANVVEDLGARPVFADVSLETFNMLPEDLAQKISNRTKAVIFVDALGNPSGLTDIKALCAHHNLPLVEDAACAIGSSENGARCGSIADLTCFSFHPRKLINTGEGGAIVTDQEDWANWLRIKLAAGIDGSKGTSADFVDFGYNFRLPELAAYMGRIQLAKLDNIVTERNELRSRYVAALAGHGLRIQSIASGVRHNVQSLVFRSPPSVSRDHLIHRLGAAGVESTIGTYALGSTSYFKNKYQAAPSNSRVLFDSTITLPCYRDVDVERVLEVVVNAIPYCHE